MKVPFLDLNAQYRELGSELDAAALRVLRSGRYVLGRELERFEREFAKACGATHCIGVSSGLDALLLILHALGIGPGDEIIVPAHTFIATWLAVSRTGASPVPVDVDPHTYTIDPLKASERITRRTKAIIAVHLYGVPAEMRPLSALARTHGLFLIEDAAQAHGARYRGHVTGSLGTAAGFSFYPAKNLGAFGDGGAVVTRAAGLAERIRVLRNYGSRNKYVHVVQGFNARLDELQAALLRVKLRKLAACNSRRRRLAALYLKGIRNPEIGLPNIPPHVDPAWHLFVVRTKHRARLMRHLEQQGIEPHIHYPVPPHRQKAYMNYRDQSFPVTERLCREILSIPMDPSMPPAAAERVIDALNRFMVPTRAKA